MRTAHHRALKTHGLRSRMSRKGDCWDNAVAESFFGTLKLELVFGETYKTRVQAKGSIIITGGFKWTVCHKGVLPKPLFFTSHFDNFCTQPRRESITKIGHFF